MNWITTNIRIPEDQYMELKMQAARERKSVAHIIRDRITDRKSVKTKKKKDVTTFFRRLDRLAKQITKENKGINFTQGLIDMRYEQ